MTSANTSAYCRGCLSPESQNNLTSLSNQNGKLKEIFKKLSCVSITEDENIFLCKKCNKKLIECFDFSEQLKKHEKEFFAPKRRQRTEVQEKTNVKCEEDILADDVLKSEVEIGKYEITEAQSVTFNDQSLATHANKETIETEHDKDEFEMIEEKFQIEDSAGQVSYEILVFGSPKNDTNESDSDQDLKYDCEICKKVFKQKASRDSHRKVVHQNIRHQCSLCDSRFTDKYYLKAHFKAVHDQIRHVCQDCGAQFSQRRGLVIHIKRIHQKIRNFSCDLCGLKFYQKKHIKTHINSHILNPNFKPKLKDTNNPNRPFRCDYENCGKYFKSNWELTKHKKTHSRDRSVAEITCSNCNRPFKTKSGRYRHLKKCFV